MGEIWAQAVFAERGELDDQVERRADLLSELGEHAFGKIGRGPDGRVEFVQVPLHGAPKTGGGRRTPAGRAALPPGGGHPYGEMLDELKYMFADLATNMFVDLAIRRTREIPARAQALTS